MKLIAVDLSGFSYWDLEGSLLKGNEDPNYLRKMRKLENILSGIPQRERGLRHLRWVFGEEEGKLN